MIGLLDPTLFLPSTDDKIQQYLDFVIQVCRKHPVDLAPMDEYWPFLWRDLAKNLEGHLQPMTKRALDEVRKIGDRSSATIPVNGPSGTAWREGFSQLFGHPAFKNTPWEKRMANAVVRAVSSGDKVVILTGRAEGRNIRVHRSEHINLEEIIRWVLHVQHTDIGHRQILCIHHPRNLVENWTTRFDWRLPANSDGGSHPFCPPDNWWKGSTVACKAVGSKVAWVDKFHNGWARPNIPSGAGYHWDVYITSDDNRINVVAYDAPLTEGKPGNIHHTSRKKQHLQTSKGWQC